MARVTVEDCIQKVDNRFELVILAAFRANKINAGAPITVERERDKPPVLSLREIAGETIDVPTLRDLIITHYQKNFKIDKVDNHDLHTEAFPINEEDELYSEDDLANMSLDEGEDSDDSDYTDNSEEET